MATTDDLLSLVRLALDEFDDRPLEVSVRRAVRIGSLLGESQVAIRLALELKPTGGHPPANAEDTRRLMTDRTSWATADGPAEKAITEYMEDRRTPDDKVVSHSLAQMDLFDREFQSMVAELSDSQRAEAFSQELLTHGVRERARHHTFTALCEWERRLTYANTNERIFGRFRGSVDRMLSDGAPAILESFNAVYRRLREAAAAGTGGAEELSQALTTCRRILKAVADHVHPPEPGCGSESGNKLDDSRYRSRLREFTRKVVDSDTRREAVEAQIAGVYERFAAVDKLANKGVHAVVAMDEAEMCAIQTYLLAGEILRLALAAGHISTPD